MFCEVKKIAVGYPGPMS